MKLPPISAHVKAQVSRAVRIFFVAIVSTGVIDAALGGGVTRTALIAALLTATEVTWRQIKPATPDVKDVSK